MISSFDRNTYTGYMKEIAAIRNRAISRSAAKDGQIQIKQQVGEYKEFIKMEKEDYDDGWEEGIFEDDLRDDPKVGEDPLY